MILDFLRDRGGNYAMLTGIAMLPIMGSVAIAIDFSEMNRQKQATVNALDAAGLATARQVASGASDEALITYANEFFKANLGSSIRPTPNSPSSCPTTSTAAAR